MLEVALAGLAVLLGAGIAVAWDLGRRQLALRVMQPEPEAVAKWEVEKLTELTSRIQLLEQGLDGVAEQALHELGLARDERKSTNAKISGQKGGLAPRRGAVVPEEEFPADSTEEERREIVRQRYDRGLQ